MNLHNYFNQNLTNDQFVALEDHSKVFRLSKNNFLDNFSFIPNRRWTFSLFFYGKQTFLVQQSIISIRARVSENWQSAVDNQKWSSLGSELTTVLTLSKLLFQWVKERLNFLFETKWRSTTWFTTFWNLQIFVIFA